MRLLAFFCTVAALLGLPALMTVAGCSSKSSGGGKPNMPESGVSDASEDTVDSGLGDTGPANEDANDYPAPHHPIPRWTSTAGRRSRTRSS